MKDHLLSRCERVARMVATAILGSDEMKLMLREAVLGVVAEQERMRDMGMARAFLAHCAASGVKVTLRGGRLFADRKLEPRLQSMANLYRAEIVEALARK